MAVLSVPASAAVYVASFSGIVSAGTDFTGVFGAAGRNLTGLNISTVMTYDTALGTVTSGPAFTSQLGGTTHAAPSFLVSTRVTIDGASYDLEGGTTEEMTQRSAAFTPGATKGTVYAISDYQEYGPFIPSPGIIGLVARHVFTVNVAAVGLPGAPQDVSTTLGDGYASLYLLRHDYNLQGNTFVQRAEAFYTPTTVSFAEYVAPPGGGGGNVGVVPEPGAWALMILGFGAAGSALRRRRNALTA